MDFSLSSSIRKPPELTELEILRKRLAGELQFPKITTEAYELEV